jgi:DNA-directed RNA polymerase specialized sigma24 family protein
MEGPLSRLRAGEIDVDVFLRETAPDWDAFAASLASRWEVPPGLDAEDVRQELLLALYEKDLVGTWDPARAVQISRYVVWGTATSAKAHIHKARGALRHRGTAKSRFPLAEAGLTSWHGGGSRETPLTRAADPGARPDEEAEARELVGRILAALPRRQRRALEVLLRCGGERGAAAEEIDGDPDLAIDCRVGSVAEARELLAAALRGARAVAG